MVVVDARLYLELRRLLLLWLLLLFPRLFQRLLLSLL
jgi:hypothetical protein